MVNLDTILQIIIMEYILVLTAVSWWLRSASSLSGTYQQEPNSPRIYHYIYLFLLVLNAPLSESDDDIIWRWTTVDYSTYNGNYETSYNLDPWICGGKMVV